MVVVVVLVQGLACHRRIPYYRRVVPSYAWYISMGLSTSFMIRWSHGAMRTDAISRGFRLPGVGVLFHEM